MTIAHVYNEHIMPTRPQHLLTFAQFNLQLNFRLYTLYTTVHILLDTIKPSDLMNEESNLFIISLFMQSIDDFAVPFLLADRT